MATDDNEAPTYTAEPLPRAMEMAGHPVARIWLACSADDADVFTCLADMLP
jgi:predicted acyl esterase